MGEGLCCHTQGGGLPSGVGGILMTHKCRLFYHLKHSIQICDGFRTIQVQWYTWHLKQVMAGLPMAIHWDLLNLKGLGNEADFLGFLQNWFLMSPLHYLSGRSDVGFAFGEIIVFEKRLTAITDTGSRWLSVSVIRGVATPHIVESGSRRLPASLIHGVGDSPHHWYGELAIEFFLKKILCIDDTERRRLPAPVIWWVAD
jgi:hypothetical protein